MTEVREHFDVFPFTSAPRVLRRDEAMLLSRAQAGPLGALWSDRDPVDVVHFAPEFVQLPFGRPRYVYDGSHARIEWQQMADTRQPIYHRNLDVDEMAYQIGGDRTLMTEHGTTELVPGDYVRIPAGVCHDNYGRRDSHILWYLPEPCAEQLTPVRTAEVRIPPFSGWEPAVVNEMITDCMGSAGGHDVVAQRSDERLILEQALTHSDRLVVVRPSDESTGDGPRSVEWIWTGSSSSVGSVDSGPTPGLDYVRHRNADEIQYQVSGRRLLVTQNGTIELEPGDFVRIPLGVAFTSISAERNRYIVTVSYHHLPRVYEASRTSEIWAYDRISDYRTTVLQPVR